jgi:hypothetical protein
MDTHRLAPWKLAVLLGGWAAFTAWCVSGFPPGMDLPAHAAQSQTIAELLRGNAEVARYYEAQFPLGYGLPIWLFLPVALVTNGAVAARAAVWTALMLFPVAHLVLARALRRPEWTVVLGLPLAFNLSYWLGFLSSFFALPFVLLSLALYVRALGSPGRAWAWAVGLALASTATMLSHLVPFGALCVGVGALALASPPRRRAVGLAAAGLAPALVLCAARVVDLATRTVTQGARLPTVYDAGSHFHWLTKHYRPEGRLAAVGAMVLTGVFVVAYVRYWRGEPRGPWVLFLALAAFFLAMPKTLSGVWLIHPRLAVLAGFASLVLVDPSRLARPIRGVLLLLSLASLGETAGFHWRFKRELAGLEELVARPPPPGVHGFLLLDGNRVLGSRIGYLEHMGVWWTATRGGVGHHFFADADHLPVRFRPGQMLPMSLTDASAETLATFSALLVYGEGPLPDTLAGFEETARAGRWRRLERRYKDPQGGSTHGTD